MNHRVTGRTSFKMHSYNLKFSVNETFKGLKNDSNITLLTKTQQTPLKDKFSEKDPKVKQKSGDKGRVGGGADNRQ